MLKFSMASEGSLEPQWVTLLDDKEGELCDGEFLIKPSRDSERRQRIKALRICPKCNGIGVLPLGENAPKCPYCHGRPDQPSFDKPEVRAVAASEICLGWRDVVADGKEFEFTSDNLTKLVTHYPATFWAMLRASDALGEGQAAASGKG